jgi:hypothetical protein
MSIRHKLNLMFLCLVVAIVSTGAIGVLFAQMILPTLPASADFGASEPPPTTSQTIAWNPLSADDPATGLILTVSNAATNVTFRLPKTAANQAAPCVLGTNFLVLTATNQFFAVPTRTNWLLWNQAWVRPIVLGSSDGSNFVEVAGGEQRAVKPFWFARAAISNWSRVEGKGLPGGN